MYDNKWSYLKEINISINWSRYKKNGGIFYVSTDFMINKKNWKILKQEYRLKIWRDEQWKLFINLCRIYRETGYK